MNIKIVFLGSPEFAIPTLDAIHKSFQVQGVITQPDRPKGRGRKLTPPPVKSKAIELGLPVLQPRSVNEPSTLDAIKEWAPDVIVVAAFGQILKREILNLPRYGCVNVHASLLPRWRGAAPIQAAILAGDDMTGCTIMKMDEGLDTGPILAQKKTPIYPEDTGGSLADKLAKIGADLLVSTLPQYISGNLKPTPQDDTKATYAPMIKKTDLILDINQDAILLERKVRAFSPVPGAHIIKDGIRIKILEAEVVEVNGTEDKSPGYIVYDNFPALQTPNGILVLKQVKPSGKKEMSGDQYLLGARNWLTT